MRSRRRGSRPRVGPRSSEPRRSSGPWPGCGPSSRPTCRRTRWCNGCSPSWTARCVPGHRGGRGPAAGGAARRRRGHPGGTGPRPFGAVGRRQADHRADVPELPAGAGHGARRDRGGPLGRRAVAGGQLARGGQARSGALRDRAGRAARAPRRAAVQPELPASARAHRARHAVDPDGSGAARRGHRVAHPGRGGRAPGDVPGRRAAAVAAGPRALQHRRPAAGPRAVGHRRQPPRLLAAPRLPDRRPAADHDHGHRPGPATVRRGPDQRRAARAAGGRRAHRNRRQDALLRDGRRPRATSCAAWRAASRDPAIPGPSRPARPGPGRFGWDTDGSYGDWYSGHELGHTFGRFHAEFCGAGGGAAYPFTERPALERRRRVRRLRRRRHRPRHPDAGAARADQARRDELLRQPVDSARSPTPGSTRGCWPRTRWPPAPARPAGTVGIGHAAHRRAQPHNPHRRRGVGAAGRRRPRRGPVAADAAAGVSVRFTDGAGAALLEQPVPFRRSVCESPATR